MMSSVSSVRTPRVLFCSYHSYLDPSSGAALSTRELLEMLASHGWECAVLCGPELDFRREGSWEEALRAEGLSFQYRPGQVVDTACTLYHWVDKGVTVHTFVPDHAQPRQPPTREQGRAFLSLFERIQQRFQADLLLTYGGQWLAFPLLRRARHKGVKTIFTLRNCNYDRGELFAEVDAILVPSRAAQEYYQRTLGLASTAIPGPFNWERVRCSRVEGRYVTFVNPQPSKGLLWFARIAYELQQRRPDIPLLVVEGRGKASWLAASDLDLRALRNVHRLANTPDPRHFYQLTRLLLVPSLWLETFARVTVEAMINGLPVLASNRGGLPEALAGAGFVLDIPPQYTPQCRQTPSAEEVTPWLSLIERLWDDAAFYEAESGRCRQAAEGWRPERLWPRFEEFFRGVLHSPAGQD
jgi:glycosyltransferase involved in cell wall biosynthesis